MPMHINRLEGCDSLPRSDGHSLRKGCCKLQLRIKLPGMSSRFGLLTESDARCHAVGGRVSHPQVKTSTIGDELLAIFFPVASFVYFISKF